MFHHVDVKSKERSWKSGIKDGSQSSSIAGSKSSHNHTGMRAGKRNQCPPSGIHRVLLPSKEDLSLCFFYQTTLESLIDVDRAQYLHLQFPTLFSQSEPGSALYLATQAISLALWAKSRPNDIDANHLSRTRYLQSLLAMKTAIQDPVEAKSDGTLYAVLLLSGYEVRLLQLEF
jgi:hypothetical protein